ncbi:hypothetical protein KP79_PYT15153 [Mizuhopecten yessoensis]|uniref:Uncharacterized protein n=1 Tax=Mizuhopecten yessoensis TaxID=6573 RepID=A0A210PRB1_MIZYE|nr:hypothetical protein KP79_PYT15153 [Mizuhopecten yessoensis]
MHNPILQRRRSSLFKGQDGTPLNLTAARKRSERDGLLTPERVSPPVALERKSSFRNGEGLTGRVPGTITPPVFVQKKHFMFKHDNYQEQTRENLFSKNYFPKSKARHERAKRHTDELLADDNYKRFVIMTISMSLFIIVVISVSLYQMIYKNFT